MAKHVDIYSPGKNLEALEELKSEIKTPEDAKTIQEWNKVYEDDLAAQRDSVVNTIGKLAAEEHEARRGEHWTDPDNTK